LCGRCAEYTHSETPANRKTEKPSRPSTSSIERETQRELLDYSILRASILQRTAMKFSHYPSANCYVICCARCALRANVSRSRTPVFFSFIYLLNFLYLPNKKGRQRGALCRPNNCLLLYSPAFETLEAWGPLGP